MGEEQVDALQTILLLSVSFKLFSNKNFKTLYKNVISDVFLRENTSELYTAAMRGDRVHAPCAKLRTKMKHKRTQALLTPK